MVDLLLSGAKTPDRRDVLDELLHMISCKAAIKAGQNLDKLEMHELIKLMQESRAFTHCPHGRPVVRMFSAADINQWFHRS